MIGRFGPQELILVFLVIMLLFGAKRLPAMARSIGQSMRILKSETRAMSSDEAEAASRSSDSSEAGPAVAQAASLPQGVVTVDPLACRDELRKDER
ncbi:Sec-independent protein translocase subunit TatA [Streptomyces sp. NBC_00879]|uniref:Sec-independent protein translocase subunit TatA n=1 Tax=Streptomyces sp. NBC_00879 TaxID=2975855 RepID=UPI003862F9D0|nr:Sec-independent protein translocase subunit TatA [Streptomyces sp. NBC_00879]